MLKIIFFLFGDIIVHIGRKKLKRHSINKKMKTYVDALVDEFQNTIL